jgi:phage terminase large subunit GpA-like protein
MLVGRLVNRNKWLWWSWMCGGCGVGVIFSSGWVCRPLCLFSMPTSACVIMIHPHHQHVAHTQPFVDVISIKVLAGGPPVTVRKPSSRFVTSHSALYCPDLVCV